MMNKIYFKGIELKNKVTSFLTEERGDTNFISILIVLVVVCALAGVFFGFRDDIMGKADKAWRKMLSKLK